MSGGGTLIGSLLFFTSLTVPLVAVPPEPLLGCEVTALGWDAIGLESVVIEDINGDIRLAFSFKVTLLPLLGPNIGFSVSGIYEVTGVREIAGSPAISLILSSRRYIADIDSYGVKRSALALGLVDTFHNDSTDFLNNDNAVGCSASTMVISAMFDDGPSSLGAASDQRYMNTLHSGVSDIRRGNVDRIASP